MSRAMNVRMEVDAVKALCEKTDIGISTLEPLPGGGVRLVCLSVDGAARARVGMKSKLLADNTPRHKLTNRRVVW